MGFEVIPKDPTGQRKSLPGWSFLFPIFFGLLGGIISAIVFRKRYRSYQLVILGLIMQFIISYLYFSI